MTRTDSKTNHLQAAIHLVGSGIVIWLSCLAVGATEHRMGRAAIAAVGLMVVTAMLQRVLDRDKESEA